MTRSRPRPRVPAASSLSVDVDANSDSDSSTYPDAHWRQVINKARAKLRNKNAQLDYGRVFSNYVTKRKLEQPTVQEARLSYSIYLVKTILTPFQMDTRDSRLTMYQTLVLNIDQGEEFEDEYDRAISSITKCREWLDTIHVNMYELISTISALHARESNPTQKIVPPERFEKKHQLHTYSDENKKIFPKHAVKGDHKNACKSLLRKFNRYHH